MKRFFILLPLCYVFACPGLSQTGNKFHIQQFNTENGLPSNGIKGLQWDDHTGFLWIATEAGVVRYNGMEFKTLTREDEPHITNERILFIVRNNAGRVFTADYTGNVFYVDKNRLVFFEKLRVFNNPSNKMFSIAVSEALYKSNTDFSGSGPYSLQFDRPLPIDDTACLAIRGGRLYYYSQTVKTPVQLYTSPLGLSMGFKIGDNFFFREGHTSVYIYDRFVNRVTRVNVVDEQTGQNLDDASNIFIWENGRKAPLLFNKGKAWILDYNGGKLKARLICDQVPVDILIRFALYNENRKTLFIGTDSKGLVVITGKKLESLRTRTPGANQRTSYYAQVELSDGNILTNEVHVIGRNVSDMTAIPVKKKFGNSIFLMGDSMLWFSQVNERLGYSCLYNYNYRTGQTTTFERIPMVNEFVMNVTNGTVYLADDKGVFAVQGDTLFNIYRHPRDGFSRIHFDMQEMEPGVFALATCNSLLRFDTRTKKMDTLFNGGNYCVRTVWQYAGYIFLGTYGGGLFVYKDGKVKALSVDKNKYLLYTHCFVKDDEGYCWISTNKGLFKTTLTELIKAFDSDSASVYYYYFGKSDGMDMTELNGGCTPCALVKKDKTISFPSMDGLLWVNPRNALPDLPDGEIYVDQFSADGKLSDPDSVAFEQLPKKTSEIIVRLGLSAWCNKENIYIDYRLNDGDWRPIDVDKGAELRFTNLPQGDYTLQLRKRNGFGKDNYSYKELSFHIAIPWYKQWWFYGLLAVLAMGLVWLYLKFRTRQYVIRQRKLEQQVSEKTKELQQKNAVLEKNDAIKTRLISIISHDIVTPLKFVTVAGKNLLDKKPLMSEELQQETIKEMTNTSQELQLLSTNILNWIKYQNENRRLARETFNVHEMVDQVLGILQSLARQKKLTVENRVDASLDIYQFYEPLKILVYNLLTNAIHFTEKGSIIISATRINGDIVISVKDDGIGMTPEQVQSLMADQVVITSVNADNKKGHGLGYLIIKDLVKTMGASLDIESKKEAGTTVKVRMPASRNTIT